MSSHFRMKKSPPSDEPIEYTIDREYLAKSLVDYEESLKKYDAENARDTEDFRE
ncbi:hypothetical protein I6G82_00090 (plasmid) [Lysinibacillus macroides]|nr:hypothetical protein I6G82_00090 [Lysinibacillus macroides]